VLHHCAFKALQLCIFQFLWGTCELFFTFLVAYYCFDVLSFFSIYWYLWFASSCYRSCEFVSRWSQISF